MSLWPNPLWLLRKIFIYSGLHRGGHHAGSPTLTEQPKLRQTRPEKDDRL